MNAKTEKIYVMQESNCKEIDNVTITRTDGSIVFSGKPDAMFFAVAMKQGKYGRRGNVTSWIDCDTNESTVDLYCSVKTIYDSLKKEVKRLKPAMHMIEMGIVMMGKDKLDDLLDSKETDEEEDDEDGDDTDD